MEKSLREYFSRIHHGTHLHSRLVITIIMITLVTARATSSHVFAQSGADFTLNVYPNYFEVTAGGTVTYPVYCTSVNNFAGTITLTLNGVPAGVVKSYSFSVNPVTLTANATVESDLTIITSSKAQPGYYSFTVTGSSSPLDHSYQINLSLLPSAGALPAALIPLIGTVLVLVATYFRRASGIRKSTRRLLDL